MNQPAMSLAELQRTMAAAVMMPLTADEEMQSHAPDGRAMNDLAATFVAPNSRLTAFERLEIYNRQYWFRVLGALAEDFPALRAVLGARSFDALAVAYLTAHPSRSFTLRNLGSKLVDFLIANPQFAARRYRIAVDIARVEWAFIEAFDGAEHSPLTPEQIATLNGNSRLVLQPHVQLLALEYPTDELVLSLHHREKRQASEAGVKYEDEDTAPVSLPGLQRRNVWVAAHRIDLTVYYRRLAEPEYLTLAALHEGKPLAEALDAGFTSSKISATRRARAVQQWFATWAELGWLCLPESDPPLQS